MSAVRLPETEVVVRIGPAPVAGDEATRSETAHRAAHQDVDLAQRRCEATIAARQASQAIAAPAPPMRPPSPMRPEPVASSQKLDTVEGDRVARGRLSTPSFANASSSGPKSPSPWLNRLQGAAMTGFLGLGALAFYVMNDAWAPSVAPTLPAALVPMDPSAAFADAFAQNALVGPARDEALDATPAETTLASAPPASAAPDSVAVAAQAPEAEIIARIAAANPPYRVVLHLAPDANPREIARLETAIRAWGFSQPEQRAATAPVAIAEVAFHAPQDREAATIVARIADRILAEAVLTPPADSVVEGAPDPSGRLDVYVITR